MSYVAAYRAVTEGDLGALSALVEQQPSLAIEVRDRDDWPGSTLLEHAVWWRREEMVEVLAAAGAPVTRSGGQPAETPLGRALELGADRIADRLAATARGREDESVSDLETAAGLGDAAGVEACLPAPEDAVRRAFRLACLGGRRTAARILAPDGWLEREALVETLLEGRHLLTWDTGETAWDWAAAQLMLADPLNLFDLSLRDARGRTVAGAAREGGHQRLASRIERRLPSGERRVAPERVWRPMNTPLEEAFLFACQWAQTPRVRDFLGQDAALINARTMWDLGPLYLPGAYGSEGSVDTALLLLDAGAEPYDGIGGPCWWGATEMVLALLERGAPPEDRAGRDSGLWNACAATSHNDPDRPEAWLPIIEGLLDAGADPNLAGRFGVTAWGLAHERMQPLLERRGARPVPRHPGLREFQEALRAGAADLERRVAADPELLELYDDRVSGCGPALEVLLDGRRDLAERWCDRKGGADLNEAAALGDADRVGELLDREGVKGPRAGAGPEDVPLHLAAWCGHAEVVELLLARGYSLAALNEADAAGTYQGPPVLRDTTPLHVAAQAGHGRIVERFIDAVDEHWS